MKPRRLSPTRVEHWPKKDRELWLSAKQPGDIFEKPGYAATWRPDTVRLVEEGYGRYLAWLQTNGGLGADQRPIERVDLDSIRSFMSDYGKGRAERTVALVLRGVAYVLRATHPPNGLPSLTKLANRLTNMGQPAKSKIDRMATSTELVDLGFTLMKKGQDELLSGYRRGAQRFRDGLMIAALAMRPLRRRNLAALQIGESFVEDSEVFRVSFKGRDTKTGRDIEFACPRQLAAPFTFYLSKARPVLLERSSAPDEGSLWIGRRGRPMDGPELTQRIRVVTKRYLGRAISPHLFRDCVATDIAIHDPKHIGIVKSVLGHATLASSQKYYNQAGSFEAAKRHRAVIARLRGGT